MKNGLTYFLIKEIFIQRIRSFKYSSNSQYKEKEKKRIFFLVI